MKKAQTVKTHCLECAMTTDHLIEYHGGEVLALECTRCFFQMKPSTDDLDRIRRISSGMQHAARARAYRYANGIPDAGR